MSANFENSAMAAGLEKVSFHSNTKERQCQRMLKLPHNCAHFTCQQGNAQNPSSQASIVHELRNSSCSSWIQKRQRSQRSNCQHPLDQRKSKGIPKKVPVKKNSISASLAMYDKAFYCEDHNNRLRILKGMVVPDCLTCPLRNLYAGQEAAVRTRQETIDWFKTGKGVCQGCILSPCLFNLYAEYIMRNSRLDEPQSGIKITRINISNLRYADDNTLTEES